MSRRPGVPRRLANGALAAWLLASLVAAPPWLPAAQAAPKGERVVKGNATFTREGDVTVIRTGKRAIIEYEGFDILAHETVRFEQPNAKSRVLNRVGGDATRIDGKLQGNGIVYLVNPAGVFFGRTAVVDVKRLVAAAGDIPDRKFLKGVDQFSLTGPIENRGAIRAGSVALLGRSVANHGQIVAPDGVIALIAGDKVVLTRLEGGISVEVEGPPEGAQNGIAQTGLVDAAEGHALFAVGDHYSLAINHSGVTRARDILVDGGGDGLVKVAGTLDASAPGPGAKGGTVRVTGDLVQLEGALVDASGAAGGGAIRIGGDLRGQGPLRSARRTVVDENSALRADAQARGDGGSAVVYGDEAAGFFGLVSARGGAAGGDGGFVELSGGALVDAGHADLGAPAGRSGTLLYDPQDIVIEGGAQDGNDSPDTNPGNLQEGNRTAGTILFADAASLVGPFVIHESEIEQTNANIVLEARNSIRASGTFDHEAAGEGAGVLRILPGNDFTARTANQPGDETGASAAPGIDLTTAAHPALEVRTSGGGTITLETGTGTTDGPEAPIRAGTLTTQGGRVSLRTEDGSVTVGSVTTTGDDGAENGVRAGDIDIGAGDEDRSNDTALLVTGDLIARGGSGGTGRGGNGGFISVGTGEADEAGNGGGATTVLGDIDASGGNGAAGAGIANNVFLVANGTADLQLGDIRAVGGASSSAGGGNGGAVTLWTDNGDIAVGAIDTRGGATASTETQEVDGDTVPRFRGGAGGGVSMSTGRGENGVGDIALNGNMTLLGGASPLEGGEGFGNKAELRAKGSIEHGGQAGPHITTSGDAACARLQCGAVVLNGTNIGALAPLEVSGGGTEAGLLGVGADGVARVVIDEGVGEGTFDDIQLIAYTPTADLQVVEGADEIVRIQDSALVRADTSEHHADLSVGRQDRLDGPDDEVGGIVFTLRTGSIDAGGHVRVLSEDDIVVGDAPGVVAVMNERVREVDPDAEPEPTRSGVLSLIADAPTVQNRQDDDGVGGVRVGAGAIVLNGDGAEEAGGLLVSSRQGIGTAANPIVTVGGGPVALETQAPREGSPPGEGIFLRNDGSGALTVKAVGAPGVSPIFGVRVLGTPGDIMLENTAGDLVIERQVSTAGNLPDGLGGADGEDGTITLRADPGTGAIRLATPIVAAVNAAGNVVLDGPVLLRQNSTVVSRGGDVDFTGAIDTAPQPDPGLPERPRSLVVLTNEVSDTSPNQKPGTIRLAGDVGASNDVRSVLFNGDVELGDGAHRLRATNTVAFLGKLDAASQDGASLAIEAGPRVEFSGDVGATPDRRLEGLSIVRNDNPVFASQPDPLVIFGGDGDQQVQTGAGGIAFGDLAAIPDRAMVAKVQGGLTLRSTGGDVVFGVNQKLTVLGDAVIAGDSVVLGDVSALTIDVQSPDAHVRTRAPGPVLVSGGGSVTDEGTDLVANEITFSDLDGPQVDGGTVRAITPDGSVTNPGPLVPVAFQRTITTGDMLRNTTVLDLTALPNDLPNEVPQPGPVIEGLVPLRPSEDPAMGSARPPDTEQTLAYLRCAASQPRDACDVVPASPLDSPRGAALAADAAQFLGSGPEAVARREALAQLEPGATRELAVFLTEIRLLGLSESEYQTVRDALFGEILTGSAAAPDADALAKAVQGQSRGVPL